MKIKLIAIFFFICLCSPAFSSTLTEMDFILDDFPIDLPLGISITTFKGTYDIIGETELRESPGSGKAEVKNGFALSLELGKVILEKIGLGMGATYQFPREINEPGSGDAKFNFIPFYGLVKFWTEAAGVFPFGMVQVGYNLLLGNDDFKRYGGQTDELTKLSGGIYWGLGGGIILLNGIQLELLYSVNNSSVTDDNPFYSGDMKYSKISISAGISL